jgi:murein DD-endopeptidase MepM/ murein hydrolase activator NlpD
VYEANRQNSQARKENKSEQEGVQAMLASVEAEVADLEHSQIPAANAALSQANANFDTAVANQEKIARRLEAAQADKDRIEKQLTDANANFDSSRVAVSSLAREEMRNTDETNTLKLVFSAGDSENFVNDLETASAAARTQTRILNNSAIVKATSATKDARLKIVNELIANLKVQADEQKAAAEKSQQDAQAWKIKVDAMEVELEQKKADLAYQKAHLEEQMALFEQQQKIIEEDMKQIALSQGGSNFDGSGGQFSFPASCTRVTCPFGGYSGHMGTDFGCGDRTPIYAAADGIVISANKPPGWLGANVIRINHGTSEGHVWMTVYAHMWDDGVFVHEGEWVSRGQQIGLIGSSGMSTGPHLHFEIRRDGVALDSQHILG